jgi:hypothetical protein
MAIKTAYGSQRYLGFPHWSVGRRLGFSFFYDLINTFCFYFLCFVTTSDLSYHKLGQGDGIFQQRCNIGRACFGAGRVKKTKTRGLHYEIPFPKGQREACISAFTGKQKNFNIFDFLFLSPS